MDDDMDRPRLSKPVRAFLRQLCETDPPRVVDWLERFLPARERQRLRQEASARHVVLGEIFGDQTIKGTASLRHHPIGRTALVREAEDLFDLSNRTVWNALERHPSLRPWVPAGPISELDLCSGIGHTQNE